MSARPMANLRPHKGSQNLVRKTEGGPMGEQETWGRGIVTSAAGMGMVSRRLRQKGGETKGRQTTCT